MSQDFGDGSGFGVALAGSSAFADVRHAGAGSGELGEDLAVQVGDGDLVAVGDDQDLYEAVRRAEHVLDLVQRQRASNGQVLRGRAFGAIAGHGLRGRPRRIA
ncbi:hypothetical protein [Nocardioides sp.]|uniref:hypothetical protein n=1 Tax=Nocardioides sp. TaxID=35761 RepID=UPI00286B7842|nr:hypothetical protein [Nocardioides sp.]